MIVFIGILFWSLIAFAVIGFMGWSTNVLMAQKKAWAEFATRYKLEVIKGRRFLEPVSVRGQLNGRQVIIYSNVEQTDNERTQRIYSHIEVYLNNPPPVRFVFSKKLLPEALGDINLPSVFTLPSPDWPSLAVSQTDDMIALANWLTRARLASLRGFMDMAGKGAETLFFCDGDMAFMLLRTEDPLRDPRELNAMVQKLYAYAKDFDSGDTGMIAKPNPSSEMPVPDMPA